MSLNRRELLTGLLAPVLGRAQQLRERKVKITGFATHKASKENRDYLFLEVRTGDGITGLGEGSMSTRVEIVEAALRWLEPYFAGADPSGIEDHWDRMYYRLNRWRDGSVLLTAMAAVDIALWDIEGKRLGVPVWRLLGGPVHPRLRVYYSHWDVTAPDASPDALAAHAVRTREQGWTAVKWVVPRAASEAARIEATVRRMEAIRKAVGPSLDLCLEMWETFTPRSALEFARAVAPYHPLFIEEPLWRESPEALGDLAARSPVALAGGEGLLTRFDFRRLLDHKGASIVQPDVIHCGGITEMRKIASFAEVYQAELAPHMWYGPVAHTASVHCASACRNFFLHEWDAASDPLFQEVTAGSCPLQKDGVVTLPQGPGLGITVDFELLKRRLPYTPRTRPAAANWKDDRHGA
jgi:galactonate dehydratase